MFVVGVEVVVVVVNVVSVTVGDEEDRSEC